MTLPSNATKTHLDSAGDDPKQARSELAGLVDKFNDLLAHLNGSTILSTPLAIGEGLENDGSGNLRAKLNGTTLTRGSSGLAAAAATETQAGVAEIATQNEANTGTDDERMLTPAKLANISPSSVTFDAANDRVLILDASDSNKLKRAALSLGEVNTAASLGDGSAVYKEKSGAELRFRSIKVATSTTNGGSVNNKVTDVSLSITVNANDLTITLNVTKGDDATGVGVGGL